MRARLALIPIVTALVLSVAPSTPAEAHPAPHTTAASIDRVAHDERSRVLSVVKLMTAGPPAVLALDPKGFIWPAHAYISSGFGMRNGHPHQGVDIMAPDHSPIVAAQSGTVTFAGVKNGYGNTTIIDHGHGISTLYAHQSKIGVKVGQHVDQGEYIGNVGSTGRVTAPHLHYEVHINGVPVNPVPWLR